MNLKKTVQILISCLFMGLFVCMLYYETKSITKYEIIMSSAMVVVFIWNLLAPIWKDTVKLNNVLGVLFGIALIVIMYSIMTYGETVIDSDVATASLLLRSQLENHSLFPKTWNYANGDIWILSTNLLLLPFYYFIKNQVLVRMLGSLTFVGVSIFLMWLVGKEYEKDWCLIAVPLTFLCLRGTYSMIIYQAAYVGSFLWIVLCPVFVYRAVLKGYDKKYIVINSLILVVLCMSGVRSLAEVVLPLSGAYCVLAYFRVKEEENIEWRNQITKICRDLSIILVPAAIGTLGFGILSSRLSINNNSVNATVYVGSLKECWENFQLVIQNIFSAFGYNGGVELASTKGLCNLISIALCIVIMFVVPFRQIKKMKSEETFIKYFIWFSIIHNMIMIVMGVFFSKTMDRYLFTSVFCHVVISARYIMKYWIKQGDFTKYLLVFSYATIVVIESLALVENSKDWRNVVEQKAQINVHLKEMGLNKGYATYWNAYNNQVYSNMDIEYGGVYLLSDSVTPMYWLVDSKVFERGAERSFLLLTQDENDQLSGDARTKISAASAKKVDYNGYVIYIYNYDIAGTID